MRACACVAAAASFSSGWVIVSCIKVIYLDFSVAFVQALFFFSSVLQGISVLSVP